MKDNGIASRDLAAKRLQLIREYVTLQEKLVTRAVSQLHSTASEFDFDESLETSITVDGVTWSTSVHGLGVRFTDPLNGIVVDVHDGFIDAPTAFDAGRLAQYCESTQKTHEEWKSWQGTLEELMRNGIIEPHKKYERHYVMK